MEGNSDLSGRVIGAAIEVHRVLGPGFAESAYESALCVELRERQIPFQRQVTLELGYKGVAVGESRIDVLVDGRLVLEIKAVEKLLPLHEQQLLSYLKITGHHIGLLINFNVEVLRRGVRRVVHNFPE